MSAQAFFYQYAGYSYPTGSNAAQIEEARQQGAQALAFAEEWARDAGIWFEWRISDVDSSEWSRVRPAWAQWDCIMRDADGAALESLGAVDFGRHSTGPYSDRYAQVHRRVVEAELAAQELAGRSRRAEDATQGVAS